MTESPAVLLVDDNPIDIDLMKAVIEEAGSYEVTTAEDGNAGKALIVSQKWAFAIIDLLLPGKDGVEIIQAGRKEHPDLHIIVISASSNAALIDAAFRAGADYHITKPIDREELLNQLHGHSDVVAAPAKAEHVPTVVAVGAGPGDVEMGCGGVLCKHREEGHKIVILNLADGGDPRSDLAAGARVAAELLTAQVENLGEEIRHVADLDGATSALQTVFEASSPGMLYVPTLSSDRPSSVESHRVVLALAEKVPNVLAYQDPGANVDFRPRFFVGLPPEMKDKLDIVAPYDRLGLSNVSTELAKANALYWGRFAEADEAEPLEVIRRGSG